MRGLLINGCQSGTTISARKVHSISSLLSRQSQTGIVHFSGFLRSGEMMSGYVKLHRAMNDNHLWLLEPFTKAQAWIDIFMNANWKDGVIEIRGNLVEVKRGQLGWSELTMAKRWKWSRNKVRRFLSYLEKTGNVEQQKSQFTTILTICNYDRYQDDSFVCDTPSGTTDDTTERQQKDNRKNTIEEGKEGKERNKRFVKPSINDVVQYCIERQNSVDAEKFYDHYEAVGWMVGKAKMKDWKAAVRTWEKNQNVTPINTSRNPNSAKYGAC